MPRAQLQHPGHLCFPSWVPCTALSLPLLIRSLPPSPQLQELLHQFPFDKLATKMPRD